MDLNSLLNNQKEVTLSLKDIQSLRADPDSALIVEKIRSFTALLYPPRIADSFIFFDTFIQLLLCIDFEDDPYGAQYTKSVVIDAFRKCINGLLQKHGNGWLIQFPSHLTPMTWVALRKNKDATILIYLYGLVLTFANESISKEWIQSLMPFMQSSYVGIIVNLWLTCSCTLEESKEIDSDYAQELFLDTLESRLENEPSFMMGVTEKFFTVLKTLDTEYLATHIDQYLGSALGRAVFTKDNFTVGYIQLENKLEDKSNLYSCLKRDYLEYKTLTDTSSESENPLICPELLEIWSVDKYEQLKSIRNGTLFWIQKQSEMTATEFDVNLKKIILQHYPTDKKTVLDLLLADWTIRDKFNRHLKFVSNVLMELLSTTPYNKRSSPYYSFIQLFNQDHSNSNYQTKSGAFIDLTEFNDNNFDQRLSNGCSNLLENVTKLKSGAHIKSWIGDCLSNGNLDTIQNYFLYLVEGFNSEYKLKKESAFEPYLRLVLTNCFQKSNVLVPIILSKFTPESLEWLLEKNKNTLCDTIIHYFDDGPQVSKYIVIQGLFKNKTKIYVQMLLSFLREKMCALNPKAPKSRIWFKNHFLSVILSLVGEDNSGQSVASCIFRELFKTRESFEWYFSTPLISQEKQLEFKSLHLANNHDLFNIKDIGLAAVFHELVKLGDATKKKRLIHLWFDLWTNNGENITVPVTWILQCAGLYDQAPVLVKQMIKQLVSIGLKEFPVEGERKFLDRIMDLVLLSDAPEPESLFELVLNIMSKSEENSIFYQEMNNSIINVLLELSEELEVELVVTEPTPGLVVTKSTPELVVTKSTPIKFEKRDRKRILKKKRNLKKKQSARILRAALKKHEEEIEKIMKDTKNNTIKPLTTLIQRIFNFLLRLLNNTRSTIDQLNTSLSMKQEIQNQLIHTPLFYEPLSKLVRLIQEPEDLQEDIQTTIDLSMESLKKSNDSKVYIASQRIMAL